MSESWDEIKTQIEEQLKAFEFMDKYGVQCYHQINRTQFRQLNNVNYTPLQGANVDRLWESAEISFEMESELQKKKNSEN